MADIIPKYESNPYIFPFHGCNINRATNQTIPDMMATTVAWSQALFDSANFFNPAAPTQITIPFTGVYLFGIELTYDAPLMIANESVTVLRNASGQLVRLAYVVNVGTATAIAGSSLHQLNNGDVLTISTTQNSGAPLDILATPPNSPQFWLKLVGYRVI